MKKIVLFCLFVAVACTSFAGFTRMNLSEAIKKHVVKVEGISNGGYQGKTTRLLLTNNDNSSLQIIVDIGTILRSDSGNCQPMVLAGEELLVLQPLKKGELLVETFCGNSPKACPARNQHFVYAGLGSDTLITVLKFIKAKSLFDELGQSAVWAITNKHDLSDIYDPNRREISEGLLEVICKATGRPRPEYYTQNAAQAQVPGAPAYQPKPLKIIASFRIILEDTKSLTLGVYNDKGEMIQKVFENKPFLKMGPEFGVEFEAADVEPGKYYIRLKEGASVLQEKMVEVR